jgi:hypothetical protein
MKLETFNSSVMFNNSSYYQILRKNNSLAIKVKNCIIIY